MAKKDRNLMRKIKDLERIKEFHKQKMQIELSELHEYPYKKKKRKKEK